MSGHRQFGPGSPEHTPESRLSGRTLSCEEWECLVTDALDDVLRTEDAAAFNRHRRECAACAQLFEEASQGKEWLGFMGREPEIPADLVEKILARTAGPAAIPLTLASRGAGGGRGWMRLPAAARRIVMHQVREPRLLMTVAMAFFSLALTLNMTGIRLSAIHLADLRPSALSTTVSRQYYQASAQITRYYENLRFVYEVEARVHELRRNAPPQIAPGQPAQPRKAPAGKNGAQPSSRLREHGGDHGPGRTSPSSLAPLISPYAPPDAAPVAAGAVAVVYHLPGEAASRRQGSGILTAHLQEKRGQSFHGVAREMEVYERGVFRARCGAAEDQAERSLA